MRRRRLPVAAALILGMVAVGGLAGCSPSGVAGALSGGGSIPTGKALCAWATPVIRSNVYSEQFHAVTFANSAAGVQVVPAGNSTIASCLFDPVYSSDGEVVTDVTAEMSVEIVSSSAGYDGAQSYDQSGAIAKDNWDGHDIYTDDGGAEWAQLASNEYLAVSMQAGIGDDTVTDQEVEGFRHDMMFNLLDLVKAGKQP